MNVYLVWNDNGEPYDEGFRYVDSVFSSWDGAARYLDDNGLERREVRFYDSKSKMVVNNVEWVPSCNNRCAMGLTQCKGFQCDKYKAWVDSNYDNINPCDDYEWLFDNYDRSYWFIEEYEMND